MWARSGSMAMVRLAFAILFIRTTITTNATTTVPGSITISMLTTGAKNVSNLTTTAMKTPVSSTPTKPSTPKATTSAKTEVSSKTTLTTSAKEGSSSMATPSTPANLSNNKSGATRVGGALTLVCLSLLMHV